MGKIVMNPQPVFLGKNVYDEISDAITVISEPHKLIHDGFVYKAWHKFTAVADAGNADMLLSVPADIFPHLHDVRVVVGAGDCDVRVYEGTTTSSDGTAVTPRSLNRNGTVDTPDLDVFHTPTVTGVGTEIRNAWVPPTATGVGQSNSGAVEDPDYEIVLKPSTKYLLRVTNNSGGAIDIHTQIYFYEIGY